MKFICFKDKNGSMNYISMDVVCEVVLSKCLVTVRLKSGLECTYANCNKDDIASLTKLLNTGSCDVRFE